MSTWPATLTAVVDEGGGVNRMDFSGFSGSSGSSGFSGRLWRCFGFQKLLGRFLCGSGVVFARFIVVASSNLVSYLSQSLIEHNSN